MDQLSTIILRFRDLVTERGQTIQRHQEISGEDSYVWWGWWHKHDETIPGECFRALVKKAEAEGVVLYLFDSGQELLYQATCIGIEWNEKYDEVASPEPTKTPEYYNEQRYLAWFKLRDISQVDNPDDTLRRWTYLRVDEFFKRSVSQYTPFYNKRIYSVRELRQQDRTIWFLRPFKHGDATHEVSLLETQAITPTHFAQQYWETQSRALLWVSDLHFSEEGHHAFPLISDTYSFTLGHQVEQSFQEKGGIGGLIISGDLTWKALPTEFNLVKEFIRRINVWSPIRSPQIAVCPGNHDLAFSTDPSKKDAKVSVVGEKSQAAYRQFYEDTFFVAPNQFLSCGKRFLLGKVIPVDIVCLNSSWLQQKAKMFQGHGFIGDGQMRDAAVQMGWDKQKNGLQAFRIVVVHHHLLPVTYRDMPVGNYPYSVVLDAEALSRWIVEHRVNLVLHGHMHQPFCAKVSRPIETKHPEKDWHEFYVVGLGSSGVKGHLGEVGKNTVGLLEFERDTLNVTVHSIDPVNPSEKIWTFTIPYKF